MKLLLEKFSELKDGYARLSKANPDPVTAQRVVDEIFRETIDLLESSIVISSLDNFSTAYGKNTDFALTARNHINGNRINFVKGETELTRLMLKPSEKENIVDTFLVRNGDSELIHDSTELREQLIFTHILYCEKIKTARALPRKHKKKEKLRLSKGLGKIIDGAEMLATNSFPFQPVPHSPFSIGSRLTGLSVLSEGLAEPLLPIYDGQDLSLIKLATFMDIGSEKLAKISQSNIHTIERVHPSTVIINRLQPLLNALKMLWQLTDGNSLKIQRWLREPLIEWRGLSPLDCLTSDRIDAVVNLVERIYYGDSAGY
jgi:Protein of unknown function (DUF2384)